MQCENFHEFYQQVANNYGILYKLTDVKVKLESVDIEEDVDWEECPVDIVEHPEAAGFEELKAEDYDEEYIPESPEYSPPRKRKRKQKFKYEEDSPQVVSVTQRGPHMTIDPADDEKIRQFAVMNCEICAVKLSSMGRAATHYKRAHNQKGYLRCCGRKFSQRYRLVDHINTHLNISYICQVCGKRFDTKQYLRNHMVHHEDLKLFVSRKIRVLMKSTGKSTQ